MRIAIDARWIFREASGIGVYTEELISSIAAEDQSNQYVLIFDAADLCRRVCRKAGLDKAGNFATEVVEFGVFSLANQVLMPRFLREQKVDVFHSPNYMIPFMAFPARPGRRPACVVTVHDVIPMIFPRHAPKSRKSRLYPIYRWLMLEVGRRADIIIADSAASRTDVISHLAIPPERQNRVQTVYCGVSTAFSPQAGGRREKAAGEARTVLYVGRSDPYKNCVGLIEAFAELRKACPFPVNLMMVGAEDTRYPEIPAKIAALGLDAAVRRAYLSDAELVDAYRGADLLALPSLYEGFGLPVVEAMACGTPVVCSNRGSLPEVAGSAAIQVDPADRQALAAAMGRVLLEPSVAREMSAKGLRQAAGFTWQRTAQATIAAYKAALE